MDEFFMTEKLKLQHILVAQVYESTIIHNKDILFYSLVALNKKYTKDNVHKTLDKLKAKNILHSDWKTMNNDMM